MKHIGYQEQTLQLMVELYCKKIHGHHQAICPECRDVLNYALDRLRSCHYLPRKGVCSRCKTPCYKPDIRKQIVEIMRFSGPRMIFKHPLLTTLYLRDKLLT